MGVLLAIPLLLGRAVYRALVTRQRIAAEVHALTRSTGRIVGFTEKKSFSESDVLEHFAIVAYETPDQEVVWAESQPCSPDMYAVNAVVDIMCSPGRARSVRIVQGNRETPGFIVFEKNFELAVSLLGIGILLAVALWYHGFAVHILGPIFAMLAAGYGLGYLTRGAGNRTDRLAAEQYQSMSSRLVAAQSDGSIPAYLTE